MFIGANKSQKPSSNSQGPKYIYNKINNIGENEPKQISMFDKYYKEKNENKDYQMNPNYYNELEKEIFQNQKKDQIYNQEKEENKFVNNKANDANMNKEVEKENENMKRTINRPPKEINQQKILLKQIKIYNKNPKC